MPDRLKSLLPILLVGIIFVSLLKINVLSGGQPEKTNLWQGFINSLGFGQKVQKQETRSFEYVPTQLQTQQESSQGPTLPPSPLPTLPPETPDNLPPILALPEEGSTLGVQTQPGENPILALPEPGGYGYNQSGNQETSVWGAVEDFFGQIFTSITISQ